MTAAAWRTSAGAAARLPVARVTNLNRALQELRSQGIFVIGLDADGDVELPGLPLAPDPLVVVVGSEGKGISRLTREHCDQIVSIPMTAGNESLNAGTPRRSRCTRSPGSAPSTRLIRQKDITTALAVAAAGRDDRYSTDLDVAFKGFPVGWTASMGVKIAKGAASTDNN
ncbi:hypothetical protein BJF82_07230 [Kytococcus sp. CUA-901]|nr:hypothetical protein BJF82_07230 [Kytococcus sp. CUA-901]